MSIDWNKRASRVERDQFGIGMGAKSIKSQCGRFMISMFKFRGASWQFVPWVLEQYRVDLDKPMSQGWRYVHGDNTKTNRTKQAAEKAILDWVRENPRKLAR